MGIDTFRLGARSFHSSSAHRFRLRYVNLESGLHKLMVRANLMAPISDTGCGETPSFALLVLGDSVFASRTMAKIVGPTVLFPRKSMADAVYRDGADTSPGDTLQLLLSTSLSGFVTRVDSLPVNVSGSGQA